MIKVKKIRHTGIVVQDLEIAKKFYIEFLGFEIVSNKVEEGIYLDKILNIRNSKITIIKIIKNNNMLELLYYHNRKEQVLYNKNIYDYGITHIAIEVDNIEDVYSKIKHEWKFDCISKPVKTENNYAKVFFCKEPGGSYIEFVELI